MVTIAIQAGGVSTRMGRDKALVALAGKPLVVHVLERVSSLGDEILLTTNRPEEYHFLGMPLITDPVPGAGSLAGLQTALRAAHGQIVIVLACDMPFVSRPLLEHMLSLARQAEVVIPSRKGEYEPLQAVYSRECLPAIEAALAAGERRMISFLPRVRVLPIEEAILTRYDPQGLSFFNVNTPQDLAEAERIWATMASN